MAFALAVGGTLFGWANAETSPIAGCVAGPRLELENLKATREFATGDGDS